MVEVRGITARPSHFAVSPASLHQIESIFLVDFRSLVRGPVTTATRSFVENPRQFNLFSLSLYFDENIFTVFPRHGFISVSLHILKERFSLFLFFFPIRHNKVKVIIFLIEKEKTGVNEVSLHLFFFLFFFLSLSVIIPLFEKMIARR